MSCATCHIPDKGFQDDRDNTSLGLSYTGRHAPTVINAAYGSAKPGATNWQFWDGRKDSLWSQALGPPESPVEMGGTRGRIALLLYDKYKSEYESVFGEIPSMRDGSNLALVPDGAMPGTDEWDSLSAEMQHQVKEIYVNFGKAIGAYQRLIVSKNSKFDRFYEELSTQDDSDIFTEQEKLGLVTFVDKGRCVPCHRGPNFTDWKFYSIGVSQDGEHLPSGDSGRMDGIAGVLGDSFNCMSEWSDHPDKAQCAVATLVADDSMLGTFKTPGLRDVSKTAPYKHTGVYRTLEEAVEHYDRGGSSAGDFLGVVDSNVRALDLSDAEKAALVAFLKTLDGEPLAPALLSAPALPQ